MSTSLTLMKNYKTQIKCDHCFSTLQCKHQLLVKYDFPNKPNVIESGNTNIQTHMILTSHKLLKKKIKEKKKKSWFQLHWGARRSMPAVMSAPPVNVNFTWKIEHVRRLTVT